MKGYLYLFMIIVIAGGICIVGIQSIGQGGPAITLKVITTPTTVTITGPVILNSIRNQSRLETVAMVIANDQDLSRVWGLEGACQEKLTYMSYYTVTAGIDLRNIEETDILVEGSGNPAQSKVTLNLPPADILHVELDTRRSRIVHSEVSIISQLCGTQLPDMVMEAQTNLRKIAEESARQEGILKNAEDRASFELQKILLKLGFTNVTINFVMPDDGPLP
jgi:hypothetical protein